jgi:hypothetical protein
MKRALLSAVSATVLVLSFATLAFAEPAKPASEQRPESAVTRAQQPRYANTAERWRGRPYLPRVGATHPAGVTGGEKVYEHVPSVNFLLEGQTGGAFVVR